MFIEKSRLVKKYAELPGLLRVFVWVVFPGCRRKNRYHRPESKAKPRVCSFAPQKSSSYLPKIVFFLLLWIDSFQLSFYTKKSCGCGGIGRRQGFKIPCLSGRAGSSPAIRTTPEQFFSPVFPLSHLVSDFAPPVLYNNKY